MATGDNVPYGQRLLPQLVDAYAKENPSRVFWIQPYTSDYREGVLKCTIRALARAVNFTAYWIEEKIGKSRNFEVVAYMGINDLRYFIFELAAMKCGFPVLLPSLRNSKANNISVFNAAKCSKLFYTDPLQAKTDGLASETFCVPSLDELLEGDGPLYPFEKTWEDAKHDPVAICHTSGSTGNPKPISYNHVMLGLVDRSRNFAAPPGRRNCGPERWSNANVFFGFPQFHVVGFIIGLGALFYEGILIFPSPNIPATSDLVVEAIKNLPVDALLLPPTVINDLVVNHPDEIREWAGPSKLVVNAGGPLLKAAGDFLSKVANVLVVLGSTEAAQILTLQPAKEDWMYYEWNPLISGARMDRLLGSGGDEDLYELVLEKKPGLEDSQGIFVTFPDITEWRMKDIFRKHPTRELWTYEGRLDDVMVLNNGEKFNPVQMEQAISAHPLVNGVLAVGTSYDQVGLIIESETSEDKLIEEVWSTVQESNRKAPAHARVYRHMILRTKPDKPFPRAGKGTIQRAAAIKDYEAEIASLFSKKKPIKSTNGPKIRLTKPVIEDFIRQAVAHQLEREDFADSDDLYFLGFDSLQTTELARLLDESLGAYLPPSSENRISARLVYDMPSVEKLTDAISTMLDPDKDALTYNVDEMAFNRMQELVKKYTADLPQRSKRPTNGTNSRGAPLHIALTGTTGFFGYYLLHRFLQDPTVGKIICLNRSSDAKAKFVTASKASPAKVQSNISKAEFLRVSSFGDKNFGLSAAVYNGLVDQVDIIIHNAWTPDFNRNLSSFENPHLIGVRTLLEWSLASPRATHIFFVSSIAAVARWPSYFPITSPVNAVAAIQNGHSHPTRVVLETPPTPPASLRANFGYAQSKYTAELILSAAARSHDIRSTILRVGQIAGPVEHHDGPQWPFANWFPLLLATSKSLGLLPRAVDETGMVDFIPVDQLAKVVRDIAVTSGTADAQEQDDEENLGIVDGKAGADVKVFSLVNPRRVSFEDLVPYIRQHFSRNSSSSNGAEGPRETKVVSLQDWIAAWEKFDENSEEDVKKYPALKMKAFFQGMVAGGGITGWQRDGEGEEEVRESDVATTEAEKASQAMREMRAVSGEDVLGWLTAWGI